MLESRLMFVRWVLTWKPWDEHPQGIRSKARIVVLVVAELKVASPTMSRIIRCSLL